VKTNIKCKEEDWLVGDFCFMNSTILTICKNRTKISGAFERNGSRIRRIRKTERSDVDEALLNWFQQERWHGTCERSSSRDDFCSSKIL